MEHNIDELEILDKNVTPDEIKADIDDIVQKLQDKNIEELKGIKQDDYTAKPTAHGEGIIATIAIAFVGALAKEAATTAWKKFIWPSLELRLKGKVKRK